MATARVHRRNKRKRQPKSRRAVTDTAELAIILSFAATSGVKAAAAEFGLSVRTVQRYQREIREGKSPELAALVAQEAKRCQRRSRDKLHRVLDAFLDRALALIPEATLSEVLGAIQGIGKLVTTREVLVGGSDDGDQGTESPAEASSGYQDPEGSGQRLKLLHQVC